MIFISHVSVESIFLGKKVRHGWGGDFGREGKSRGVIARKFHSMRPSHSQPMPNPEGAVSVPYLLPLPLPVHLVLPPPLKEPLPFPSHAALGETRIRDRVGPLIFGREDVPYHKPDSRFYLQALWGIAHRQHNAGEVPKGGVEISDTVFFGDRIGGASDDELDISESRRHSVVLVNSGEIPPPGPLSVVAKDIPTLLSMVQYPAQRQNHVIARLARTLQLS